MLEFGKNVWFHAGGIVGCYCYHRDSGWIAFAGGVNEYGFPLDNPTSATGFWRSLVGQVL